MFNQSYKPKNDWVIVNFVIMQQMEIKSKNELGFRTDSLKVKLTDFPQIQKWR